MVKHAIYEVDLFHPVERYLLNQGYSVHGEVNDCDVVAVKEDRLVIFELKVRFNLALLIQATKRQRLTDFVYVAIPKPSYSRRSRKWQDLCYLIRRLELGLLVVSFDQQDPEVEIIYEPKAFDRVRSQRQSKGRKDKLLKEIAGRRTNKNIGGSSQRKIMTAYKESCIFIACCLAKCGPLTPQALREIGTGDQTYSILYKNHYGWFERVERGVYTLTEKGILEHQADPALVQSYYRLIRN